METLIESFEKLKVSQKDNGSRKGAKVRNDLILNILNCIISLRLCAFA